LGQGEWGFQFDASIDFFGLITLSGSGFLDSRGDFSMVLDGYVQIGPDGFNIHGSFHFNFTSINFSDITGNDYYVLDLSVSASAGVDIFGVSFGVDISASFHAEGAGSVPVELSVSAKIGFEVLGHFVGFTVSHTFTLGYLQ